VTILGLFWQQRRRAAISRHQTRQWVRRVGKNVENVFPYLDEPCRPSQNYDCGLLRAVSSKSGLKSLSGLCSCFHELDELVG